MTPRRWTLIGVFAALLLGYALFFTEWLRPAPIEIVSQVRFAVQPPRFGRPAPKVTVPLPGTPGKPVTNQVVQRYLVERIGRPAKGTIDQAPGGAANVTFSLDAVYQLTHVRVEDVPADGSKPKILWEIGGKSVPTRALLYNRVPEGMKPIGLMTNAEPLVPEAPYRLILEAGRRKGTNHFTTTAVR